MEVRSALAVCFSRSARALPLMSSLSGFGRSGPLQRDLRRDRRNAPAPSPSPATPASFRATSVERCGLFSLKSAVTASPVALSALISMRGAEILASSVSLSSVPVAACRRPSRRRRTSPADRRGSRRSGSPSRRASGLLPFARARRTRACRRLFPRRGRWRALRRTARAPARDARSRVGDRGALDRRRRRYRSRTGAPHLDSSFFAPSPGRPLLGRFASRRSPKLNLPSLLLHDVRLAGRRRGSGRRSPRRAAAAGARPRRGPIRATGTAALDARAPRA